MSFMELQVTQKGVLYTADCCKCGCSMFSHEWATWNHNERRDAMQAGTALCEECMVGTADPDTFRKHGRKHYAARYSAPGYMDRTDWNYGTNRRALVREMRDMYGEG